MGWSRQRSSKPPSQGVAFRSLTILQQCGAAHYFHTSPQKPSDCTSTNLPDRSNLIESALDARPFFLYSRNPSNRAVLQRYSRPMHQYYATACRICAHDPQRRSDPDKDRRKRDSAAIPWQFHGCSRRLWMLPILSTRNPRGNVECSREKGREEV